MKIGMASAIIKIILYIYIYIVPHQNLYSSIENIENKTISEKVVRKNRHESQDSGRF